MEPPPAIVIATRDRAASLTATLERLARLPERPEVVVVDNGSRDATVAVALGAGARVVALGTDRGAAARNVGARLVDAPLVAFADDDSWWAPGALATVARRFAAAPQLGLVAARVLVGDAERLDPVCAAMERGPRDALGHAVHGFVACGAVVRREAFLAAGGFHPRFGIGGEEELLARRLTARGLRVRHQPDVVAHHHPSPARDRQARRQREVRNELWTRWLLDGPRGAAAATGRALWAARRDDAAARGTVQGLVGLPWVARERLAHGP
ncbi:glycosyltransferase family 2 protein [Conexibacter sp. SYSU D00693]|uniref:glycosyltransferase family 2 protein n=1 Tax=Conexibacter sp. SYSU D00693 TaxID=2812560 RepID=UPI00196A7D23|nr:glycosyltransferase [Conexibacter sp. SYSU D00693]